MATRSDLRSLVREETLVETADVSNTVLNDVFDRAIWDLAPRFDWPWLAAIDIIDFTANTQSYDLPADWLRTAAIVRIGKRRNLAELSYREAFELYGDDFPTGDETRAFFQWGREIYVIPVPTTTQTGMLRLYYYQQPTLLTNDTSEPEWADEFHDVLVPYVVEWVWKREEDFAKAAEARANYLERVNRMATFYANQHEDEPTVWGQRIKKSNFRGINSNMPFLYDV